VIFLGTIFNNFKINIIAVLLSIFLLGIFYQYPNTTINIGSIIYSIKEEVFLSGLIGFALSLVMMIGYKLNNSLIITPLSLFFTVIIILPAFSIPWGELIALVGTAGKMFGLLVGYAISEKIK